MPSVLRSAARPSAGNRAARLAAGDSPFFRIRLLVSCLAVISLGLGSCAAPPRGAGEPAPAPPIPVDTGAPASQGEPPASAGTQRIVREGIAVEFSVVPADPAQRETGKLFEGGNVRVQFRITDTATGSPATTLEPAAWMHPAAPDVDCKTKIRSFLDGSFTSRAKLDLNVYYVLTLNDDASISVVDPLFGYGGSRLLAMAILKSPGEDWVLSSNQARLFVTMPQVNQVAVVDTATWKVTADIDAGQRPIRIALQPDGKYLWVGSDGVSSLDLTSGVTIIDAEKLEKVTQIPTGVGHHEIAFSDDDRYAFITNTDANTLSVIDIRSLQKVKDIDCGRSPVSVAYSALGRAAYVVSRDEGLIRVIDGRSLEVAARIEAEPGLGALRFARGGRLGFVVNTEKNLVHIIDASTNRLIQTADVGEAPDQVAFTETLAYVRSRGTEIVLMIPLDQVGQEGAPVPIIDFTGGHAPFGQGSLAIADGIVPAPGGTSVLVANPVDEVVYYYREGMAAPMGEFKNYDRQPRAVLVVDRSLNEIEPGLYATDIRLDGLSGEVEVAFFLNSPSIIHCFSLEVLPDPNTPARDLRPAIRIESLLGDEVLLSGKPARVRFKVTDPRSDRPRSDVKDFAVMAASTGNWHELQRAHPVGEGIYEIEFTPPRPGTYYLSFQSGSLNLRLNDHRPVIVRVNGEG